jgi:uncharacterized phage protein (predicted DNA packaging)
MITLDQAKKHLNLEPDFVEDDEYILGLISMAEQAVRVHVNEDFDKLAEDNGGCFPAPLQQAMLLMIGNMYQNREPLGTRNAALPFNYQYLINLYQNYSN